MGLEQVINKVISQIGYDSAVCLSQGNRDRIFAEEASVRTMAGVPLDNVALQDCMKRKYLLCVIGSPGHSVPDGDIVKIVDGNGHILGRHVPKSQKDKYKSEKGYIWLSDDFVISPDELTILDMRVKLMPVSVDFLGSAEGVESCSMMFPSSTTDMLIKDLMGMSCDPVHFTALLSVDFISDNIESDQKIDIDTDDNC